MVERRVTRTVEIGDKIIGGDNPIAVQSMTTTPTQDISATVRQVKLLEKAGADIIRIAVDSQKDVGALAQIRQQTNSTLCVDLQENYRLASLAAPYADKIRYNPGHLYHHEKNKSTGDKVASIIEQAVRHNCAIRIGVNCGSVDPEITSKFDPSDSITPVVISALEHCNIFDELGFTRYCVSIKDSDPKKVIQANVLFAQQRPDVPLHIGVTEAGLPPNGVNKSRYALGKLLSMGIGETLRISLTVTHELKGMEVEVGKQLIDDVMRNIPLPQLKTGLNIISCPSCSRVENEAFVKLAQKIEEETAYIADKDMSIAVMGCRVNGPGETDNADLGLWCGPTHVNLKRGSQLIGKYTYDEVLARLKDEAERLLES